MYLSERQVPVVSVFPNISRVICCSVHYWESGINVFSREKCYLTLEYMNFVIFWKLTRNYDPPLSLSHFVDRNVLHCFNNLFRYVRYTMCLFYFVGVFFFLSTVGLGLYMLLLVEVDTSQVFHYWNNFVYNQHMTPHMNSWWTL